MALQPKFPQIPPHFRPRLGELRLELLNLFLRLLNIDLLVLSNRVDVTGNIQIEIVLPDLLVCRPTSVLLDRLEIFIGRRDFLDVLRAEFILVLGVFVFAAGVDEQNVGRLLAAIKDQYRGRDVCAVKEIRGQADHSFEQVLQDYLLYDPSLGAATTPQSTRFPYATLSVV